MDEPAYDQDRTGSVGSALRAAREAQGLTLAEVADRTRVPLRHLAAVEQGSHEGLPAATYSTGFVRTYARLLGLDAHALSQRFRAELANREPMVPHRQESYEPADPARVPGKGLAFGTLALAVLVLLGYLYWRGSGLRGPAEIALTPAPAPTALAGDRPISVPAQTPPPAASSAAMPIAPAPGETALLTAEQPVWLRVSDAGGTRLFQGVLNPGDHFQVPATATDPRLRTSRATALKVTVGTVTIPPLGPPETLIKDISLKTEALLARVNTPTPPAAASRQ